MATCYGQPPPVIPVPTIDRRIVPQPGPIIEAAATPWRWQTSTEPVGAWATPVDTRAYPDRWQTPIPGPIPPERALPHLYQDRGQPPIATLPAPIVSCWTAGAADPVRLKRATPWLYQATTEPLAQWITSIDVRAYPDRWSCPQPGPVTGAKSTPYFYQAHTLPLAVWQGTPAVVPDPSLWHVGVVYPVRPIRMWTGYDPGCGTQLPWYADTALCVPVFEAGLESLVEGGCGVESIVAGMSGLATVVFADDVAIELIVEMTVGIENAIGGDGGLL
jgi:hypothetical protein